MKRNNLIITKTLALGNVIQYKEDFIKYIDVDDKTLNTYRVGINAFEEYLRQNNIKKPTRDDVIDFRDYLRDNKSSNTTNTYMIAIRSLFKYLSIKGIYPNIAVDIKGAKYSTTPKKQVLSLDMTREIYSNLTDKREKALFSLLITTGLRGIEVARAKIEDIKLYNGEVVLWIQCKKHDSKDEYVKLSNEVIEDLKEYIGDRESGYIFISTSNNSYGKGMTTTSIRKIIKNIFKRFGLDDEQFSLHSTRRTSATLMYSLGINTHDIQQILHHKSPNTTIRYINAITRNENKGEYAVSKALFN